MAEKFFKVHGVLSRLGRTGKLFLVLLLLQVVSWGMARLTGVTLPGRELLDFLFAVLALLLGVRYARRLIRRVLWWMRNRLIVAYIFIGVVPIVLILAMLAIGMTILMGQAAAYLMTAELNRRNESIRSS
ncbi:MAG: hypothetical protein HY652_08295, partial [Acidobacteria bacterium]|nr:hypothetical protein [Acidobacteriota bacterium]